MRQNQQKQLLELGLLCDYIGNVVRLPELFSVVVSTNHRSPRQRLTDMSDWKAGYQAALSDVLYIMEEILGSKHS